MMTAGSMRITAGLLVSILITQFVILPSRRVEAEVPMRVQHAVNEALDYLARTQEIDGSWPDTYGKSPAVVGLIILAYLAHGEVPGRGKYRDTLDRAIEYLVNSAQETGLVSRPGSQPMYNHGFSTLALAEVYGMSPRKEIARILNDAVKLIARTQNSKGGWRYQPRPVDDDITVTGCQLMALRAARNAGVDVPKEVIDKGIQYILSCAHPEGGFAYRPGGTPGKARTGLAVLLLQLLGEEDSEDVKKGADYLLKNQLMPGETYFYYALYYCSQAMYQKGGKYWEFWEKEMTDIILARQNLDGSFNTSGSSGGAYYAVAMAVLALEIKWKYLPIYQR